MSPQEFEEKMQDIYNFYEIKNGDTEASHLQMDGLMCEVLSSLGYEEGVKFFERACKWYA